jgi:hypothetical protein
VCVELSTVYRLYNAPKSQESIGTQMTQPDQNQCAFLYEISLCVKSRRKLINWKRARVRTLPKAYSQSSKSNGTFCNVANEL